MLKYNSSSAALCVTMGIVSIIIVMYCMLQAASVCTITYTTMIGY